MRRKLLSVVLCVCMMMTMAPFAFAAEGAKVAKVGSEEYTSLQAAVNAVGDNGATVTLLNNVVLDSTLVLNKSLTLDLNGHKISNGSSLSGYLIKIEHPSNVSIVGNKQNSSIVDTRNNATGTITAICVFGELTVNGSYLTISRGANGIAIKVDEQSPNQGKLTVNSGTISVDTATTTSSQAIQNWGTTIINGGTFKGDVDSCSYSNIAGKMTINGGTFNGDVYSAQMKYTTYNYDWPTASAQIAIKNGNFNKTIFECYLDDTNGLQPIQSVTKPDGVTESEVSVSGGTFYANPTSYLVADYSAKNSNGKYLVVPTKADNAVAQIGNTYYNTLADAVADANNSSKDTIKLLRNTSLNSTVSISKPVVLDLGGYTLSGAGTLLDLYGDVTIQNGTIETTGAGTGAVWVNQTAKLTVNNDVLMNTTQASSFAIAYWNDCTTAEVTFRGKITGGNGITMNGLINNGTHNELLVDGAEIIVSDHGIYQAGYSETAFSINNSVISGATGIEVRAGNLNVTNSAISGKGTFSCVANGGGSTTDGAGIAIVQHTTKLPINVTISGGEISGPYAIYESNPQNNGSEDISKVTLSITGGKFNGPIYSQDLTGFISGGYFTSDPSAYCTNGLTGISSSLANYPWTVGTKSNTKAEVASGAPTVKTDLAYDDDSPEKALLEATKTALSSADVDGNGIATAAADLANNNTVTADTNVVGSLNSAIGNGSTQATTTNTNIVIQTYMDMQITGVSTENDKKSITVDIQPMYRTVATTANVKTGDEIVLTNSDSGKTVNAVQIGDPKPLTITGETTVTIQLPAGFVNKDSNRNYPKVYVQHKGHEYTATVTEKTKAAGTISAATLIATFTNPDGFSPFTISTKSTAVAEIGENKYTTLQAAVDAVKDGETINVTGTDLSATVSGNKTFTVNPNGKTVTLTAASGYNLTNNGNVYTVSRQHSGSSSSGTTTSYNVNVNAATNGTVAADKKTAAKGATVTVTATPSTGYVVDAVKVVDKDGKDVAVTVKDGKYVFTMPGSAVTVTGTFKAETPAPSGLPFVDVKSGDWFYGAVKYAYENGLMTGTSATTFAPNGTMNRAMIVTVLYRLEKSPAVTGASKFTDVPAGQWYSDAVAWAAANKIVNGYSETTFGPMNAVTREQLAAILFRYEQYKGLENVTLEENLNRFPDHEKISGYAVPALQWAVGQKIINGNADGTLDPTGTATRAQVAQILTNLLNK